MIFAIKRNIYNFDPYNVLLAIAINILQRLQTGFVLQGHKYLTLNFYVVNAFIIFDFYDSVIQFCVTLQT